MTILRPVMGNIIGGGGIFILREFSSSTTWIKQPGLVAAYIVGIGGGGGGRGSSLGADRRGKGGSHGTPPSPPPPSPPPSEANSVT